MDIATKDIDIDIKVTNLILGNCELTDEGIEKDISEEDAKEILRLFGLSSSEGLEGFEE